MTEPASLISPYSFSSALTCSYEQHPFEKHFALFQAAHRQEVGETRRTFTIALPPSPPIPGLWDEQLPPLGLWDNNSKVERAIDEWLPSGMSDTRMGDRQIRLSWCDLVKAILNRSVSCKLALSPEEVLILHVLEREPYFGLMDDEEIGAVFPQRPVSPEQVSRFRKNWGIASAEKWDASSCLTRVEASLSFLELQKCKTKCIEAFCKSAISSL